MEKTFLEKASWFHELNKYTERENILFVGSTFIQQFPINELEFNFHVNEAVYNRGIKELKIKEFKELLEVCVFELYPSKIILNIGEEDIKDPAFNLKKFIEEYISIIEQIQNKLPKAKLYIMGILPVDKNYKRTNQLLQEKVQEKGLEFLDFSERLLDDKQEVSSIYTHDGNHFLPEAYVVILRDLKRFFRNRMMGFGDVWNMIGNWY